MKKSILTFTFFLFLGATLFAQDNRPAVEDEIILMTRTAQQQGLPVVTDIIFIQNVEVMTAEEVTPNEEEVSNISSSYNFVRGGPSIEDLDAANNVDSVEDGSNQRKGTHDYCSEATVYPNPANSYTNLILPTREDYDVYLFDMVGNQKMYWTFTNTLSERLDLMDFQTGIYFIQLVCGDKTQTLRLKIVK